MKDKKIREWDKNFYNFLNEKNISEDIINELKNNNLTSQYGSFILASMLEGSELVIRYGNFWWVEYQGEIIDSQNKKIYLKNDKHPESFMRINNKFLKKDNIENNDIIAELVHLATVQNKDCFKLLEKLENMGVINETHRDNARKLLTHDIAKKIDRMLAKKEKEEEEKLKKSSLPKQKV